MFVPPIRMVHPGTPLPGWEVQFMGIVIEHKNGHHYLHKMDVVCGYCGGETF